MNIKELKEKDFSHLEGKEIILSFPNNIGKFTVIVAGFDYYVGMTLKYKKTLKEAACYNGASSPNPDYLDPDLDYYDYDKWFLYSVKAIEAGFYCVKTCLIESDDVGVNNETDFNGGVECAFSTWQ